MSCDGDNDKRLRLPAHDVSLHVCRGYASISFAGVIAAQWKRVRKPIFAYYLGDYDPSGFDIERDLWEKLERYSGKARLTEGDDAGAPGFHWRRLGVVHEDFARHNLVRLPVKTKDRRTKAFVLKRGRDCAELDALPPTEVRLRVREAIESHIDQERWRRLQETERLEKETVASVLKGMGGGNRT